MEKVKVFLPIGLNQAVDQDRLMAVGAALGRIERGEASDEDREALKQCLIVHEDNYNPAFDALLLTVTAR